MEHSHQQFPNTMSGKGSAIAPSSSKQNGWTALPTFRSPPVNGQKDNGPSHSPCVNGQQDKGHSSRENGRQNNGHSPHLNGRQESGPSHSPSVVRRQESGLSHSPCVARRQESTSHVQHLTLLICNSLWGQKLTFLSFVNGESLVPFSLLWPDKHTLVDTFREAEFNKRPFELCKLLLATNSTKSLDALLEEQVSHHLLLLKVPNSNCVSKQQLNIVHHL